MANVAKNDRPSKPLPDMSTEELEMAVRWWNSSKHEQFHYKISTTGPQLSGVVKVNLQSWLTLEQILLEMISSVWFGCKFAGR